MAKKWIVIIVLLVTVILGALYMRSRKGYEVVMPKKGNITEAVYGLGVVRSHKVYEVKIGVLNSIQRIYYEEGDRVQKGKLMINFVEGARFEAPFSGTVTAVNFNEGETAPPQASVMRIEDLKDLYIEVSLEQEGALRVSPGDPVKILFESIRGEVLKGKIQSLFPREGEFIAQIEVEGLSEKVLPGMTADVTIEVGQISDAILIPISSIHNGMVIVQRDGKKKKVKVQIGHVDNMWAEVTDNSISLSDEILVQSKESD